MHSSEILTPLAVPVQSADPSQQSGIHTRQTQRVLRAVIADLIAQTRPNGGAGGGGGGGGEDETVSKKVGEDLLASTNGEEDAAIAVMRELYVNGDADGALAIASLVTIADEEMKKLKERFDVVDPFGGLIPVEDNNNDDATTTDIPIDESAVEAACVDDDDDVEMLDERDVETHWDGQSIPRMTVSSVSIVDARVAAFVALINGVNTLNRILTLSKMPEPEALSLFTALIERRVVELG